MRLSLIRTTLLLCCAFSLNSSAQQQPSSSDAQAAGLMQRAHALMAGTAAINDATITGSVRRIAGSDDESGTATLKALLTGEASAEFSLPSGRRMEVRGDADGNGGGRRIGPDGTAHAIPEHNTKVESAWFFPAILLRRAVTGQSKSLRYLGQETIGNQTLEHIRVAARNPAAPDRAPAQVAQLVQHLTETDFYLDSATLLPFKITFNDHPENDASRDVPVEVRFSDYRAVDGVQIPFHVQKYFNGSLILDIQADSAALNSGLTAASLPVQ